jgi:Cell division protein FtsQ
VISRLWKGVAVVVAVIAVAFVFQRLFGDKTAVGAVQVPDPVALIGSGADAVAVTGGGAVVRWWPLPDEPTLPRLPLSEPPKGGHLAGPMLEQARVLGAAPPALRPYLAASHFGESGVDVETTSGIELRFGDTSLVAQKWQAAAAILADPEITALDYVDLHAPRRPTYAGSGHTLPPAP